MDGASGVGSIEMRNLLKNLKRFFALPTDESAEDWAQRATW